MSSSWAGDDTARDGPEPASVLAVGEVFADFRILEELGRGAMGVVYRAAELQDANRIGALKVLTAFGRGEDSESSAARGRFLREAKIACGLRHPNLARADGFGEERGLMYLVSEFLEGGDLELLLAGARLRPEAAALVGLDLAHGLSELERRGLIHRDLKPSNVLFGRDGVARLSDFGLARSTDPARTALTGTGMILGTPAYIAPEQVEGRRDLDIRCDLYSLGGILFRALTGRPPFQRATIPALLRARLKEEAPDPRGFVANLDEDLAQLVSSLLARDRALRPSLAAVLARLKASVEAPPGPDWNRLFWLRDARVEREEKEPRIEARTAALSAGEAIPSLLRRVRLDLSGDPARSLFVYCGPRLRLGRDRIGESGQDICLRLRSSERKDRLSLQLSARHLSLRAARDGVELTELGSRHGTTLSGRSLSAGRALHFGPGRYELRLAEVLSLRLQVFPRGAGRACSTLIERVDDGVDHAYLLLSGPLPIGPAGPLAPGSRGALQLLNAGGGLWWRSGEAEWRPLCAGEDVRCGEFRVKARAIEAADQK